MSAGETVKIIAAIQVPHLPSHFVKRKGVNEIKDPKMTGTTLSQTMPLPKIFSKTVRI
jgi:hypothetical protein